MFVFFGQNLTISECPEDPDALTLFYGVKCTQIRSKTFTKLVKQRQTVSCFKWSTQLQQKKNSTSFKLRTGDPKLQTYENFRNKLSQKIFEFGSSTFRLAN